MHVVVGPVASASVLAWANYAQAVLSNDPIAPTPVEDIPADATGSLLGYITEWQDAARRQPVFLWESDVPSEVAEYLVLAFYRVVQRLAKAAEARGGRMAPPEGETFYVMLVHGLLDALASEGPAAAEFSDHLRSFWPGLET